MKRLLFTFALAVLAIESQTSVGTISVSVIDFVTKSPVRNAAIKLGADLNSLPEEKGKTGADGRLAINGLSPGSYRILVTAPGYPLQLYGALGPAQMGSEVIIGGATNHPEVVVEVFPAGEVNGLIVDEDGAPVSGVTVELLARRPYRGGVEGVSLGSRVSGDDGAYLFKSVTPGSYYLRIQRYPQIGTKKADKEAGCLPNLMYYPGVLDANGAAPFTVFTGQRAELGKLKLMRRDCFLVRVKIDSSATLLDAAMLPADSFAIQMPPTQTAVIKADDKFILFPQVTTGDYFLMLQNAASSKLPAQLQRIRVTDADVTAAARVDSGNVTGSLRRLDREKIRDGDFPKEIELQSLVFVGGTQVAQVAPDGTFHFTGVKEGDYHLWFKQLPDGVYPSSILLDGVAVAGQRFHYRGEGDEHVAIDLQCCGTSITGTVEDDSQQHNRMLVVVLLPEPLAARTPDRMLVTITASDGSFSFPSVPTGSYKVLAMDNLKFTQGIDPEFATRYESAGVVVEAGEHATAGLRVKLIHVPLSER